MKITSLLILHNYRLGQIAVSFWVLNTFPQQSIRHVIYIIYKYSDTPLSMNPDKCLACTDVCGFLSAEVQLEHYAIGEDSEHRTFTSNIYGT